MIDDALKVLDHSCDQDVMMLYVDKPDKIRETNVVVVLKHPGWS